MLELVVILNNVSILVLDHKNIISIVWLVEGLIDTAVKTSRSGYLQRCLTKQLEGVHVSYDNSVRDADGTLIQFLYGGDAVDTTKQSHMNQFKFCVDNYDALLTKYNPGDMTENIDTELALSYSKKVRKSLKKQKMYHIMIKLLNMIQC